MLLTFFPKVWFKGKKLIVLGLLSLLLFILVTAANTVLTLDPSLPLNITENVNLTLSANFSNEEGFFSSKNLNQFSDGSESKNLTFKGENHVIYLKLPKDIVVTSATFDLTGYEYNDYAYFSFENEKFIDYNGLVNFFGKSGVGMVEPDVFVKNIPIDFTANQLGLNYYHLGGPVGGSGPLAEFIYSIQVCPIDIDNTCVSDSTVLVSNFTVNNHPNDTHDVLFETLYDFKKGSSYKISFISLTSQESNSLYQAYAAEGNCLWNDNEDSWDECSPKNNTIFLKLYPEPLGPYNPSFYVGEYEDNAWTYEGYLIDTQTTPDLAEDFNYYLSSCEADEEGNCVVPIVFSSETIGIVNISNLQVTYHNLIGNLCQVCIAADGECDTEWFDTMTEYVDDFSGMCSHYWNTFKYNHSTYEVGFRIEDSQGEKATALKEITLYKPLELNNYTLSSNLAKVGDIVAVSTNWTWMNRTENNINTWPGNHVYDLNNITCSLYADADTLIQLGKSNASSWCNFAYYVNVSDYPSISFYVKGMDKEGREGITPTMLVKVGLNQTIEADTATEFDYTSIADSNITFFLGNNVEAIIAVEAENVTSSPSGLNSLKAIDIEVDAATKDSLLWGLIKIFYNESELTLANIPDESTLKIYYYNESAGQWQLQSNQGVDTENNYVWVNVTHFSTYGVFGDEPVPPSPSSSGGGGGGSGGSGGGSSSKPANNTVSTSAPVENPAEPSSVSEPALGAPTQAEEESAPVENLAQPSESSSSSLTGAAVGWVSDTAKERPIAAGVLLFALLLFGLLVYQSMRKKKNIVV